MRTLSQQYELAPLTGPPIDGWTWVNQGSSTLNYVANNKIHIDRPATASASLALLARSVGSSAIVTAKVASPGGPAQYAGPIVGWRESSTGKLIVIYNRNAGVQVNIEKWSSPTSYSSGVNYYAEEWSWVQLEDTGTNLIIRLSATGIPGTFHQYWTESRTAYMAGGPDQAVFGVRDANAAMSGTLLSWDQTA